MRYGEWVRRMRLRQSLGVYAPVTVILTVILCHRNPYDFKVIALLLGLVMIDALHNECVQMEYSRCVESIGPGDPYLGKFSIGLHEVLQAHFLLIDFFFDVGEGIGGVGPKSTNLLHSALARQFAEYGGKPRWTDRIEICASLMYGLIKNHPFYDANKRTAFLTSLLHLQKIGRTPIVSHQEFEDFTVAIAENSLDGYPNYKDMSCDEFDRDILFIARYLKKSTRKIDLQRKHITYNDLNAILTKRGLYLDNPIGNRIDLVRREAQNLANLAIASPKLDSMVGQKK